MKVSIRRAVLVAGVIGAALSATAGPASAALSDQRCFGRKPTIVGTDGNDKMRGTSGNDVIITGRGRDEVRAGRGHDRICTGRSSDKIIAGRGNDRVLGGPFLDILHGGPGHDLLITVARDIPERGYREDAYGEEGNDEIVGGANPDHLSGGPGNDVIRGGGNADDLTSELLMGGSGDDELSIAQTADWRKFYEAHFAPGPGDDVVSAGEYRATLDYSLSDAAVEVDVAAGSATGEGTDLFGGIGHVEGSPLDDVLIGDDVYNRLGGGPGNDSVDGGAGTDELYGGWSTFVAAQALGHTVIEEGASTGSGNDTVSGGGGDDIIRGYDGDDTLDGGDGTDEVHGGEGMDSCFNGETETDCE